MTEKKTKKFFSSEVKIPLTFKIADKLIGEGRPVLIIAEAGCNHNGSMALAKKMVDVACEAGADVVKFQIFKTEDLVTRSTKKADYQKKGKQDKESYFELLKKLEFVREEFKELKRYCDKKGIIFMCTPHSGTSSLKMLEDDAFPAYKIGSGDLTNIPFLEEVARKGKPIILGTGMSYLHEVKEAVDAIKGAGNDLIVLLHCTTNYPCKIQDVNLKAMDTMKKKFGALVGYSDHTLGIDVPIAATALGATIIEKHFTLHRDMEGPDQKASIEPDELKEMVRAIRSVETCLGSSEKRPNNEELKIMEIARKSVIADKDIKKGAIIRKEDLIIKRPGTGLHPRTMKSIIGRVAVKDIKKDSLIQKDDFKASIIGHAS